MRKFCLGISVQDLWTIYLDIIALCVIQDLLFNFEWPCTLTFTFLVLLALWPEGANTTDKIFLTFVE